MLFLFSIHNIVEAARWSELSFKLLNCLTQSIQNTYKYKVTKCTIHFIYILYFIYIYIYIDYRNYNV